MPPTGSPRTRRVLQFAVLVVALGVGILCGYFIGRDTVLRHTGKYKPPTGLADASVPAVSYLQLTQLPPPGSEAAERLLADDATPSGVRGLYAYYRDSDTISEEATEAFLRRLQADLKASPETAQVDLAPFLRVARDVLAYLRYSGADILLRLLRQYAQTGTFSPGDYDPDALHDEGKRLLRPEGLNAWFGSMARKDTTESLLLPPAKAAFKANVSQELEPGDRRLLLRHLHSHGHDHDHGLLTAGGGSARRLQAAAAIPSIPPKVAAAERTVPTISPTQSLIDMVCAAQPFRPDGSVAPILPKASTCIDKKPQGLFAYGDVAFRPIVIPLVFHLHRFNATPGGEPMMPPAWEPDEAGQHLVDVANKLYEGSGVQFKLQEVRHDAKKYPYLWLSSLDSFYTCSTTYDEIAANFPCLSQTAADPSVAALAAQHVINVFVSGCLPWPNSPGCTPTSKANILLGYSRAIGPWFSADARQRTPGAMDWKEGDAGQNWMWLVWDLFDPRIANSPRFNDRGGVTLAHELGHALGMMHTHEGTTDSTCATEGSLVAGDAVPDTPVNQDIETYAAKENLFNSLAGWCTDFRKGAAPKLEELMPFNSCPPAEKTDNVFNMMSYVPDQCYMVVTANQIARMQWAVATFRPKFMAANAV